MRLFGGIEIWWLFGGLPRIHEKGCGKMKRIVKMEKSKRHMSHAAGAVFLFLAACVGATNAFAITTGTCPAVPDPAIYNGACIDGLRPGGYPYFSTDVNVSWKAKTNTLVAYYAATGASQFILDQSTSYGITDTTINFWANINTADQDAGTIGHWEILGNMPDPAFNITNAPVLMSADLSGVYRQDGALIGFNTMNIECNAAIDAAIAGGCTQNESLYLDLNNPIDFSLSAQDSPGKITASGVGLSTVPLPAAAWLFGAGLLGLLGVSRRSQAA